MYGVNSPAGFIPVRSLASANPFNDGLETFPLLITGGLGGYRGDLIRAEASGYVQQVSVGQQGSAVAHYPLGVAQSFSWLGVSHEKYYKSPAFVPGTPIASGTQVTCFSIADPMQIYTIQTDEALGLQQTDTFNNFAFTATATYAVGGQNYPKGNDVTGISSVMLDQATLVTTAANTVGRILGLTVENNNSWYIPGTNTVGYNNVNVILNNHFLTQAVGV